jgi:hypothetical protein
MNVHAFTCPQARDAALPRDFAILCLWSAFGLALSGLFVIAGFGADIAQALGAAG